MEVVENAVFAEGKSAEGDDDDDEFVQPAHMVGDQEMDCGRHEDDGMVRMVKLDAITIHKADCWVQVTDRDGESL